MADLLSAINIIIHSLLSQTKLRRTRPVVYLSLSRNLVLPVNLSHTTLSVKLNISLPSHKKSRNPSEIENDREEKTHLICSPLVTQNW